MKKFLLIFICFLFIPAFAINWVELTTPSGKTVYLDLDSVTDYDGYYFYNIHNLTSPDVLTVQSDKKRSFAAKIDSFPLDGYKGDYQSITKNMTKNLEPVNFGSVVHTCAKKIKETNDIKNSIEILQ